MGSALMRGRAGAPCACFGARSTVSALAVLRNLALAAAFAVGPVPSLRRAQHRRLAGHRPRRRAARLRGPRRRGSGARARGRDAAASGRYPGRARDRRRGPARSGRRSAALARRIAFEGHAELGLAVFSSEGCHLCQTLAPAIENVARDPLVAAGVFDEAADAALWRELDVPGSPFAIAIGRDATVLAKGTFNNLAQLESVLATAERRRREGTGEPVDSGLGGFPIGA